MISRYAIFVGLAAWAIGTAAPPALGFGGKKPDSQVQVGAAATEEAANPLQVQKDVITELILDASGSMKQKVQNRTKLFQAKRVLKSFMQEAHEDNMVLGLRVYGLKEKDCKNTDLVLNFGEKGVDAIDGAMERIDPKGYGKTPLALSLQKAAEDLKKYDKQPKRLIVVTDGIESCQGDPCKVARELKAAMDIKIFVVGYTLDEKDRRQIQCLADATGGKFFDARDLPSLAKAMKDLSRQDKNLFVKSPDPIGMSEVWRGGKKVAQFVSSLGTRLEPGVDYEIRVMLKPVFTFPHVKLAPAEVRTLVVQGLGKVNVHFNSALFTITLLDEHGKAVATFQSDTETAVPVGFYKVKAQATPFAETVIDDIMVTPGGFHEDYVKGFGAFEIRTDAKVHGKGPFGMYVFDDVKKVDLGSYLTDLPTVVPLGRYTVKSVGNAIVKNVYAEPAKVAEIPLPAAGKTFTYARRESKKELEDEAKAERDAIAAGRKAPVMLDSLTPEELERHNKGLK